MFLIDVFERYEEMRTSVKRASLDQMRYSVNAFEKWGKMRLTIDELNAENLTAYVRWRMKLAGAKTVSRNISDVLSLMRFAARWIMPGLIVPKLDPVQVPRSIPVAWTVQEVTAIVERCQSLDGWMRDLPITRSAWWMALILFLYDSGSRIHAATSLSVHDFDPVMRTATLRGEHAKTGIEQVVDLSPETVVAMQALIDAQGQGAVNVFPYPWNKRKRWREFHEIMRESGVRTGKYVGFHRIRKTHATQQVIVLGWDHARVALGHSTESMTRRYVDLRQIPRTPLSIPRLAITGRSGKGN